METPAPGIYQHYKGGEYRLYEIATHSETGELLAVYRPLYGDRALWVRPLMMWSEEVAVGDETLQRFRFLRPAGADENRE
jgi:hypothetical protein